MALWPPSSATKPLAGIEGVRARYAQLFQRLGTGPAAMDYTQGQLGPIPGEWVGAGDRSRTMLYFHGGGFVAGSPETHRGLVGKLVDVSREGTKCTTFKACADLLKAGTNIDYDGKSGPVEFSPKGDPLEASIGIYTYDANNTIPATAQVYKSGKLDG